MASPSFLINVIQHNCRYHHLPLLHRNLPLSLLLHLSPPTLSRLHLHLHLRLLLPLFLFLLLLLLSFSFSAYLISPVLSYSILPSILSLFVFSYLRTLKHTPYPLHTHSHTHTLPRTLTLTHTYNLTTTGNCLPDS